MKTVMCELFRSLWWWWWCTLSLTLTARPAHTLSSRLRTSQEGIEQNLFKLINYIRTRISPSFPAGKFLLLASSAPALLFVVCMKHEGFSHKISPQFSSTLPPHCRPLPRSRVVVAAPCESFYSLIYRYESRSVSRTKVNEGEESVAEHAWLGGFWCVWVVKPRTSMQKTKALVLEN